MVPLKSFTKAFRGPSEEEIVQGLSADNMAPKSPPRLPREPFRNLPRMQDRRERYSDELSVEVEEPSLFPLPPSPGSSIGKRREADVPLDSDNGSSESSGAKSLGATGRAPIVGGTPLVKPFVKPKVGSGSTGSKPASVKPKSEPVHNRPNQADVGEPTTSKASMTSRRTASNAVITESPVSNTGDTQNLLTEIAKQDSKAAATGFEVNAIAAPPRSPATSLMEVATKEVVTIDEDADRNTIATEPPDLDELPKINRSSNQVTEIKCRASELNRDGEPNTDSRPAGTPSDSRPLNHEMLVPSVKVNVNGPSALLVNLESSFEVVAKNDGRIPLNGLAVRVAVPKHVTMGAFSASAGSAQLDHDQDGNAIVWQLEHLEAGESKALKLLLQSAQPEHFALGLEWTLMPQLAEIQLQVQQPQLAIAIEGPSEVEFGKAQTYRIRVKNPGNADAKDVEIALTAEPYGSNQSNIGDVAAGAERVVEVEMLFKQSGLLPVVATASSAVSQLKAQSAVDVQVRQSELIATWFGPAEFYQGSIVDYELELTNMGTIAAVGVECKVKLPQGAEGITLPPGATRSGDTVKWNVNRIEPSQKLQVPFRMTLSKLGENALAFEATCSSSVDAAATILTSIDSIADLHLAVMNPVAPAPVGQPVVYEIVITNRGKKAASGVEVVAQFSDGIEPIRLEGGAGRIITGQAIFNSIASIKPNEKLTLKVVAEASKSGVHRFRAEVKCIDSDADLLEEQSTRFLATGNRPDRR